MTGLESLEGHSAGVTHATFDGYALGGLPEQPESHAAYYRLHGSVRPQPLEHPQSFDDLLSAFELQWRSACGEQDLPRVRETIKAQLARTEWAR